MSVTLWYWNNICCAIGRFEVINSEIDKCTVTILNQTRNIPENDIPENPSWVPAMRKWLVNLAQRRQIALHSLSSGCATTKHWVSNTSFPKRHRRRLGVSEDEIFWTRVDGNNGKGNEPKLTAFRNIKLVVDGASPPLDCVFYVTCMQARWRDSI